MVREETTWISSEYPRMNLNAARIGMQHKIRKMPGRRLSMGNDKKSKSSRGGAGMKTWGVEEPDSFENCWDQCGCH